MNDMKTITTAVRQKTGGKKSSTLLECVRALKEMGALSVDVSHENIKATFPEARPSFHVEPVTKEKIEQQEIVLGYPKDLLLHST